MSSLQEQVDSEGEVFVPACPFCQSDDTWLFGTFDAGEGEFAVWGCNNPACPNVEFEHFFSQEDIGVFRVEFFDPPYTFGAPTLEEVRQFAETRLEQLYPGEWQVSEDDLQYVPKGKDVPGWPVLARLRLPDREMLQREIEHWQRLADEYREGSKRAEGELRKLRGQLEETANGL